MNQAKCGESSSLPTSTDPTPSRSPRSRTVSLSMTSIKPIIPDFYSLDAPPSLLSQSDILARLAHGPTLLPSSLANFISAVSVCSRISIRSAALFIEAILESVKQGMMTGLGLTRRALISAVASARTLHYVAKGLDWHGRDNQGVKDNGMYLGLLDQYTNVGIYLINHVFTLAELFSIAGLSLTMSTTSLGFTAAEESVRLLDSLLGSGETSRALSAIINLVRTEMADDPTFTISQKGVIPTLSLLTKTLTAFVCLQAATSKRTAKEMKMRVIYDCTVVAEGGESTLEFVPWPPSVNINHSIEDPITRDPFIVESNANHDDVAARRRSRAPSVESIASDLRKGNLTMSGTNSPISRRSRTNSVADSERVDLEEETEIVEELTDLYGMHEMVSGDEAEEGEDDLPHEVRKALEQLEYLQDGEGKTFVTSDRGSRYEIEVTETTTTTTTTVRTTETEDASQLERNRTISRRSRPRIGVPQLMGHGEDLLDDEMKSEEWVDINGKRAISLVSGDDFEMADGDGLIATIPISPNGGPTVANEDGTKPRLQVVLRTMTKKFTQRKRTIRRVDQAAVVPSPPSSGSSTPRPRRIAAKSPEAENIEPDSSPSSSPTSHKVRGGGSRVLKAFGKALKKSASGDGEGSGKSLNGFFSPSRSDPNSRELSRESTASSYGARSPPRSPGMTPLSTVSEQPKRSSISRRPSAMDLAFAGRRGSLTPLDAVPANSKVAARPQLTSASSTSALAPRLRRADSMLSIVTTCKHSQSTPTEEPEPKAANFPRQHLVANLQRFMRYSSAAYGQAFLRILGLGKNRGLDFTFPNTKTHANNHAFAHHVGIPVDDILLDSYTTPGGGIFDNHRISPIVNYVSVDHAMKAIVLSCRGSLGLSDILVDLVCSYEQIHVPDGDRDAVYQVHAGMWHSASRLQRGRVHQTIKEALELYPGYGLVLTGHSLGGGVSSLLSLLWSTPSHVFERNRTSGDAHRYPPIFTPFVTSYASGLPAGRPIHCYAYGTPCVASPDLVGYCRGLVTSTTHNNDVIPTLSLGTLRDLKTMAMTLHEDRGNGTTREIIGRVCGIYQRKLSVATSNRLARTLPGGVDPTPSLYDISDEARMVALSKAEISAGRGNNRALDPAYRDPTLQGAETPEDLVVNDYLWSVMRTLRADNDNDKLYPPGQVYVIENYTVFISSDSRPGQYARREGRRILLRAVNDVVKRFSEPVFGKTLFMDHSPSGYEENVDLLARAVLG